MTSKTDKVLIGHRTGANKADSAKVAETLGITPKDTEVVLAFTNLLNSLIEEAAVEQVTAEGETVVRKKFPNNERAIDEMDPGKIEKLALDYVLKSTFIYPTGSILKDAPIEQAKKDVVWASQRLVQSPADEERELSYAKKLKWLAQMRCQQEYKELLRPIQQLVHHEMIGRPYKPTEEITADAVAADEDLSILMA